MSVSDARNEGNADQSAPYPGEAGWIPVTLAVGVTCPSSVGCSSCSKVRKCPGSDEGIITRGDFPLAQHGH